jgi:preprotein translocase subunit SecD
VTEQLLVKKKADLPGDMVSAAFATFDQRGWGINLRFNSKGAELFGELTAANVGQRFRDRARWCGQVRALHQ